MPDQGYLIRPSGDPGKPLVTLLEVFVETRDRLIGALVIRFQRKSLLVLFYCILSLALINPVTDKLRVKRAGKKELSRLALDILTIWIAGNRTPE